MHGIIKDQMKSKERMDAFFAGKAIDRLPIIPLLGEPAAKFIGVSIREYAHSTELLVKAETFCYKTFGCDGVGVGPSLHGIAEAMGTQLVYKEFISPFVGQPILKDAALLDQLVPVNPSRDGRLPIFLEALKILVETLGSEVGVGSTLGGPFTTATSLRGTENFLKDTLRNPEGAHKLLQLVTESALNYIDAASDLGAGISIAEPAATGNMISVKMFREFAKPYLLRYVERIKKKTGKAPSLHICGDSSRLWEDMVEIGAGTLSLDNVVDLAQAKERVGHQVCLMGNIKPVETVYLGSKQDIFAEVRECVRKMYDNPKGIHSCRIFPQGPEV